MSSIVGNILIVDKLINNLLRVLVVSSLDDLVTFHRVECISKQTLSFSLGHQVGICSMTAIPLLASSVPSTSILSVK